MRLSGKSQVKTESVQIEEGLRGVDPSARRYYYRIVGNQIRFGWIPRPLPFVDLSEAVFVDSAREWETLIVFEIAALEDD